MVLEAAPEEVRHLYEERPAISAKAGFQLIRKTAKTISVQVVVITNVEGRARIGSPTKQKLSLIV